MRRKDKEINELAVIESIISRAHVCRLALSDEDRPYVVPLCFGYTDNTLYFHSAREGKKLDILRKNNKVCFEFDIDHELVEADEACDWGMKYRSVIGFGEASLIEDPEAKRSALDVIMKHYAVRPYKCTNKPVEGLIIIKVDIENLTGRKSGYA